MDIQAPIYNWQQYKFGSISLCMIMKNEGKVLRRCLESVNGLVDEIIIVDTGSTDNSIDIAKSYGAKVYSDPWQDDFSRPRNIGLEKASCNWILIMDPDEMIYHAHHAAIRHMTRAKNVVAFWMTTRNYSNPTQDMTYRHMRGQKDPTGKFPGFTPSVKTRFFRNGLGIRFKGCWHELVDWYLLDNKMKTGSSPIPIHHWNHEISQKTISDKTMMYIRLGEKKVKEWPENGQAWWELGVAQSIAGQRDAAARSIAEAFRRGFGTQHQYFTLARCLNLDGKKEKSRLSFEKGMCALFPALTHIDKTKKPMQTLLNGLEVDKCTT